MSYNRINRFKEHLQEIQGNCDLCDTHFLVNIQNELNGQEITADAIKRIIKKYDKKEYYEHIPTFLKHLNQKVIYFTADEEKTLCSLFDCINNKYSSLFPGISFFNFNYITYKLAEHIKHPDLHMLTILKNQNIKDMDEKWKMLCEEFGWVFISSSEH